VAQKIIYFVRHGETILNAQSIRQGPDGPLSEKGREQVLATAKKFLLEKPKPEAIVASPFERTKETAAIISSELGLPVEYNDLLVERKNPTEIVGHSGKEETVQQIVDRIDKSYHDDSLRFSDEENFVDLRDRARKLLEYIAARKESRLIMVTHGIFLKMVICYLLLGDKLTASEYNNLSHLNPMDNAGVTICSYTTGWFKKPEWKLLVWNNLEYAPEAKEEEEYAR
jgi:broad specificity phosphatase PhoE